MSETSGQQGLYLTNTQFSLKNELMNKELLQDTVLSVFTYIILFTFHLTPLA